MPVEVWSSILRLLRCPLFSLWNATQTVHKKTLFFKKKKDQVLKDSMQADFNWNASKWETAGFVTFCCISNVRNAIFIIIIIYFFYITSIPFWVQTKFFFLLKVTFRKRFKRGRESACG